MGTSLQHKLLTTALTLALSCGSLIHPQAVRAADSGSASTRLMVTATILKHAHLKIISQMAAVKITQDDIQRGYADVPTGSRLEIHSNSPDGYVLEFESQSDFVRETQVRGLGNTVQLGAQGGVVSQSQLGGGLTRVTVELGFRFLLSENAQPGTYAWPLHVSVMPIYTSRGLS